MIVAATLLCDRKADSQLVAIPPLVEALKASGQDWRLHLNVEVSKLEYSFEQVDNYIISSPHIEKFSSDIWSLDSSWLQRPKFDQDNSRVYRIAHARNMCIDYAISMNADYLLFVDADVVIKENAVSRLLESIAFENDAYIGGVVPGRGAHRHARYVFNHRRTQGYVTYCDHGTCGLLLIKKDVFNRVRFHCGPYTHGTPPQTTWLSEDPMFAIDCRNMGLQEYWPIDNRVVAEHVGDLKADETVEGYSSPL